MAKKNRKYDFDDEDDIVVIDKKTKRRLERAKNRENQQQRALEEETAPAPAPEEGKDVMSQIASLCQENRWREAVLTARKTLAEAENGEENENSEFVPEGIKSLMPYMRIIRTLTEKYATLVMNPPYMGGGNMNPVLSNYVKKN